MNFLIVDDHAIVRKGLTELLREGFISINITEASNSIEVDAKLKNKVWDFILLDISMPGQNGIEILKQLRAFGIKAPILMLSTHSDDLYALRLLNTGANGFLNKNDAPDELINAIKKILSGKKYVTAILAEKLIESSDTIQKRTHLLLSDRESQIFLLLASGSSVSEIAVSISLRIDVVKAYQIQIMEKMRFATNAELSQYAFERRLLE